jgi:hypothetical protein
MDLAWWQYAVALGGLAFIWLFVEMISYVMTERATARSRSAHGFRFLIAIAIFLALFTIAWWFHRLIFH